MTRDTRIMGEKKKILMGARWAHRPCFFYEVNGRPNNKKKTMGAKWAPHQNVEISSQKIVTEAIWAQNFPVRWKNKKKWMRKLPMNLFLK